MDLNTLLLDLEDLSEDEAFTEGRRGFESLYIQSEHAGTIPLHGGGTATFYKDRYDHAFRTSPDRARNPYSKARVALDRIARVKWIKEILVGNVVGTECWHVRPQSGRNHPLDRLYVHWAYGYVVWLQPRKDGGWRFSSAFPAAQAEIARFTRGGSLQWRADTQNKIAP